MNHYLMRNLAGMYQTKYDKQSHPTKIIKNASENSGL